MTVSRSLKEIVSDMPKVVGDSIEFTKIEKWEVSKVNLLAQKQTIEKDIVTKQTQLNEINNLLLMFGPKIKPGA